LGIDLTDAPVFWSIEVGEDQGFADRRRCYDVSVTLPGPLVFFGTPRFAVPTLEALCAVGASPAFVVTQPARRVGRGRKLIEPPVALEARALGLAPRFVGKVGSEDFLTDLVAFSPWLAVVVAFGQIFPQRLLDIPTEGCVNLHGSLLPKYRGAAPIQAAIADGESLTGVTTMKMEAGLDSGPVLLKREVEIGAGETTPELAARLAAVGAELVVETVRGLVAGNLVETPQDDAESSYAPKLTREDAVVDWSRCARDLFNRWRAFTPWPGSVTEFRGEPVKIGACRPAERGAASSPPGTIIQTAPELYVACGENSVLRIGSLQRPGRSVVDSASFVNGERVQAGECFTRA
jgi:methionyl-tRNA formyltransferase